MNRKRHIPTWGEDSSRTRQDEQKSPSAPCGIAAERVAITKARLAIVRASSSHSDFEDELLDLHEICKRVQKTSDIFSYEGGFRAEQEISPMVELGQLSTQQEEALTTLAKLSDDVRVEVLMGEEFHGYSKNEKAVGPLYEYLISNVGGACQYQYAFLYVEEGFPAMGLHLLINAAQEGYKPAIFHYY